MTSWLEKLLAAFRGSLHEHARIRRALLQCEKERARVEITRTSSNGESQHRPIIAAIAQVRHDDFSVLSASGQKLPTNEAVNVSIFQSSGRMKFGSKVLGACRVVDGDTDHQSGGIRLAMPDRLQAINHRKHVRVPLDAMAPVHVSLRSETSEEPIRGVLRDLSLGGARVEIDSSVIVMKGSRLIMLAQLPKPGSALAEPARVVRIEHYHRSGRAVLGLAFDEEAARLQPFIRRLETQRAKQAHHTQHASSFAAR